MKKFLIFTIVFSFLFCGGLAEDAAIEPIPDEHSIPVGSENSYFRAPTYFEFEDSKITLGVGEIYQPTYYTDAPEWGIDFYSKSSKIVTVDEDGTIYAKKRGSTKIEAHTAFGPSATLKVEVKKAPTSIKLPSSLNLHVGETVPIKVRLSSGSASNIHWFADNERIVTADFNLVYGHKAGTTYLTAETYNGRRATCRISVYKWPTRIYLDDIYVKKGKSFKVVPRFKSNELDTYTLHISNTKIAKVSGTTLKAKKRGITTLRVRTTNGIEKEVDVYVY